MKNKSYNNGKSSINNESIPILRVRNLKNTLYPAAVNID